MEQLWPAATVGPQFDVFMKSDVFAPVSVNCKLRSIVPVFESAMACVLLVVPVTCTPNEIVAGERTMADAPEGTTFGRGRLV